MLETLGREFESSSVSEALPANVTAFRRAVFAGFVAAGAFTVLLGPILPVLTARWSLNGSQAGLFFAAQFTGALLGVGAFSLLPRRYSYRFPLAIGYALMGTGMILLRSPELRMAQLGIFAAGFANGLVTPASNLAIAMESPVERAGRLNLLNFTWGFGAVGCPFLVAFAERLHNLNLFFLLFGATLVFLAVLFVSLRRPSVPLGDTPSTKMERPRASRSLVLVLGCFGALFFLEVGAESSFGGWAASFASEIAKAPATTVALMPSFFWGTMFIGRASATALLRRVSEKRVIFSCMSLVLCSSLILLVARQTAILALAIAIAGFGCSAIFPTLLAWVSHSVDESSAGLRALPFAAAYCGGAILPWLVGAASVRLGSLRAGFLFVVAAAAIMLLLSALLHRAIPQAAAVA